MNIHKQDEDKESLHSKINIQNINRVQMQDITFLIQSQFRPKRLNINQMVQYCIKIIKMYRSNTYDVAINRKYVTQTPPRSLHPRIKSLQKIKVNRKGLPHDFFSTKPQNQISILSQNHIKMMTSPPQSQLRTTPKFIQEVSQSITQKKRQSKSEERAQIQQKKLSSAFSQKNNNVTFSSPFFSCSPRPKPKKIQLKGKKQLLNRKPKECKIVETPMKKEILQLMKQKRIEKQMCGYMYGSEQKRKQMFPILKGRYPSAFGV